MFNTELEKEIEEEAHFDEKKRTERPHLHNIRSLYEKGFSTQDICDFYGKTPEDIERILKNE